ncbi:MAG: glycosyltransferase family 4 protein [Candidatus Eremiobacteraeota bacterium]|nr:glycosyltransferase family 4 protein [Candidatus Eremiobacteraeota bacterium]
MKVALDAQLSVGTATGIGEYACGLAGALRRRGVEVLELRDSRLDPWRFDRRLLWDQAILPLRARRSGADVLHCVAGTVPWSGGLPIVVTVHDLAWHGAQRHAPSYARYYFGRFSLRRYRRAAAIVVDSNFSRQELFALMPDVDSTRVHVIYPGVAADFCDLERSTGDGLTILAVGTIERRKNLEVLVRALSLLKNSRLIAVGPQTPYAGECARLAERLGLTGRIDMRGYVPRDELIGLYRTCAVAAVPSRYEGFGYAAAQALCAGLPCVVADRSSLPEVAGGDARVVGVDDPEAWASALALALTGRDDARAAGARARARARFSWDACARRIEAVYANSIDR